MKWVIAPLVAAFLFVGSAWLNALERTTVASAELAESSRSAPATTSSAAQDVETLPVIARLTEQQSVAFRALADALAASATRVEKLNGSIDEQVASVQRLESAIEGFGDYISCTEERVNGLVAASRRVPPGLDAIARIMRRLTVIQDESIRRLKSINRKLALLGVAAAATDVKAPPLPSPGEPPAPGSSPSPLAC